jgi:phospholysine phosphohistidine inorganic pyrophosphate phosphatase
VLGRLRRSEIPFRLVTNTTSRPRSAILQRLRSYGFEASADEIFTATLAGADLARSSGWSRVAPFLLEPALEDLRDLDLVGGTSGRRVSQVPEAVLIGDLGERWSYALMQEAFTHLMSGAALIALSRDRYWLQNETLVLDAGPFVAGLEFATGREATVAGKPSGAFYATALRGLEISTARESVMVGDDLWSDVQGAQRAGLQGWLVRTGKYSESALQASGIHPDRILDSIAALI